MSAEDDREVREELARVEQLIASLARDPNEQTEETPDNADAASDLTSAAEDVAVLDQLNARRDHLRAQLGASEGG